MADATFIAEVPVIDVHAHILLMETLGGCGEAGPETGTRDGVTYLRAGHQVIRNLDFVGSPLSNIELRLELMQRLGIDHQILSPMPMFYFYDQPPEAAIRFAALHNDEMAKLVRSMPEKFSGLATLPVQDPVAAAEELRRAVTELGLCGAQIGQGAGGSPLSEAANEIIWETCEALGVPVIIHPEPLAGGAGPSPATTGEWDLNMVAGLPGLEFSVAAELVFSGILDRHPGLKVIIPHGGGSLPFNRDRITMALNRRPWGRHCLRRPVEDVLGQLWFDCLVHGSAALRFLIEAAGSHRIVLGSSAAAWDQDDEIVARIHSLGLPASDMDSVLWRNASEVFGLNKPARCQ